MKPSLFTGVSGLDPGVLADDCVFVWERIQILLLY
jgi:hypothetical protein